MKKLIAMLLALTLVLCLAACGSKTDAPESGKQPEKEETRAPVAEKPSATEAPAGPWGVTDSFTAFANGKICNFYINLPELTAIPKGSGLMAYQPDGSFVVIDVQLMVDPIIVEGVDQVLPAYFKQTRVMMELYHGISYEHVAFEVTAQENVTVNGYEMCRYEGTHEYTMDGTAATNKFVAYATQLKTNGAYIYWMVLDETAEQSLGKTIGDHAYNMALSLEEE